jgi:hypothetical protein
MSIFPFSRHYNFAIEAAPDPTPQSEDLNTRPNWIVVMGFVSMLLVLAIASDVFLVWAIGTFVGN